MSTQTIRLPQEGEKLGSGILLSLISTGGSAYVYKTWIDSLEINRAVKVMSPDAEPDVRDRFQTEARINSKLIHPNIVQCYNFGITSGNLPFLEVEYLSGLALSDLIRKRGGVELPAALAILTGVLEALSYAHTVKYTLYEKQHIGLIHRDLKPANIFLTGEGVVKLMDFGIARPVDFSIHTVAGTVPGTIAYMSPEACSGGEVNFQSDIYQAGLLFFELLTGSPAFPQTDLAALIAAKTNNTLPSLKSRLPELNLHALSIFEKSTALIPQNRYESAHHFLSEVRALSLSLCGNVQPVSIIQAFLDGRPMVYQQSPVAFRKKRLLIMAAALLICFAFLFFWVFSFVRPSPRNQETAINRPLPAAPQRPIPAPVSQPAPVHPITPSSRSSKVVAAAPQVPSKPLPVAPASPVTPPLKDEALILINQGKSQYGADAFPEALASFQQALKTPSNIAREEILKTSIYWSARCNLALYKQGKLPLTNYTASWRSVQNLFPAGTPEHSEAALNLSEIK